MHASIERQYPAGRFSNVHATPSNVIQVDGMGCKSALSDLGQAAFSHRDIRSRVTRTYQCSRSALRRSRKGMSTNSPGPRSSSHCRNSATAHFHFYREIARLGGKTQHQTRSTTYQILDEFLILRKDRFPFVVADTENAIGVEGVRPTAREVRYGSRRIALLHSRRLACLVTHANVHIAFRRPQVTDGRRVFDVGP